jgi:hypothetical protein
MADTTVTLNTIATLGTEIEFATTPATATGANDTEVFAITPTKAGRKLIIGVVNGAADQGAIAYSIAAGDLWAANGSKTGSVAQGKTEILMFDSAKYIDNDGIIKITLTPATGKILLTNHVAAVYAIQTI